MLLIMDCRQSVPLQGMWLAMTCTQLNDATGYQGLVTNSEISYYCWFDFSIVYRTYLVHKQNSYIREIDIIENKLNSL